MARRGKVTLASGENFDVVDLYGDGLIQFSGTRSGYGEVVQKNSGSVIVENGAVVIETQDATGLLASVINLDGIVEAKGIDKVGGTITLDGGTQSGVVVKGKLDASSDTRKGGTVEIDGGATTVNPSAEIDVSGRNGGFASIRSDSVTLVNGTVKADTSLADGHGGDISIEGDLLAQVDGDGISAKGGVDSGRGGNVRVKSPVAVTIGGQADLTGQDRLGTLTVEVDQDTSIQGLALLPNRFSTDWLENQLDLANVTIHSTGNHDVNVESKVDWSGPGGLTLKADRDVNLNSILKAGHADAFVTLDALDDVNITAQTLNASGIDIAGDVTLLAGDDITIEGISKKVVIVTLSNGAYVKSSQGNVKLDAGDDVIIKGSNRAEGFAQIKTDTGKIDIKAQDVIMTDGAGQANTRINAAGNLNIIGDQTLTATNINSTGGTGRINLQSPQITLLRNADANGGNIWLNHAGSYTETGIVNAAAGSLKTSGTGDIIAHQNAGGVIQNLIDAVGTMGDRLALFIGAGDYTTSDAAGVTVKHSLTEIYGAQKGVDGRDRTATESTVNSFTIAQNIQNVLIDGFTIIGRAIDAAYINGQLASGQKAGVLLHTGSGDVTLRNNRFINGVGDNSHAVVTSSLGVSGLTVLKNQFTNWMHSIFLQPNVHNVAIRNNNFKGGALTDYSLIAYATDGLAVSGNLFDFTPISIRSRTYATGVAGGTANTQNMTFTGNTLKTATGWPGYMVNRDKLLRLNASNNHYEVREDPSNPASPKVLLKPGEMTKAQLYWLEDQVDHALDNANYGVVIMKPDHFFVTNESWGTGGGIQRAVNASTDGFTIHLPDAPAWNEAITIDGKALKLSGEGKQKSQLKPLSLADGQAVITLLNGADVTLRKLTVDALANNDAGYGVNVLDSSLTFRNSRVLGGDIGIRVEGPESHLQFKGAENRLKGQTTYYIALYDGAMDNEEINARRVGFNNHDSEDYKGNKPLRDQIEEKLWDEDDDADVGQIFLSRKDLPDDTVPGGGENTTPGGGDDTTPGGGENTTPGGGENTTPGGGENTTPGGGENTTPGGGENTTPGGGENTTPGGGENTTPGGGENTTPGGGENTTPGGEDPDTTPGGEGGESSDDTTPGGEANNASNQFQQRIGGSGEFRMSYASAVFSTGDATGYNFDPANVNLSLLNQGGGGGFDPSSIPDANLENIAPAAGPGSNAGNPSGQCGNSYLSGGFDPNFNAENCSQ